MEHNPYPETARDRDRWILERRGSRAVLNPERPQAFLVEQEPAADGKLLETATIFLTNRECPFRCVMCDLWQHTLTTTVDEGAIPRQIEFALGNAGRVEQVKLYNSGSFFDPRAVPETDYPAIAEQLTAAGRVIVECHPAFLGDRVRRFRSLLPGALEIAIGLESADERVLPRLNKRMALADFSRAAEFVLNSGMDLRVFVLLAPPFLKPSEGLTSTIQSVAHAFTCGASVVSLIPTRAGNGAMEALRSLGLYQPPSLANIEACFAEAMRGKQGRLFLDLWDLEQFSVCANCLPQRRARLEAMNLRQENLPPVACHECGAGI